MDKDFRTSGTPTFIATFDDSRWLMVSFTGESIRLGAYDKDQQRLNLNITAETLYGMVLDFHAKDVDAERDDQKTEAAIAEN